MGGTFMADRPLKSSTSSQIKTARPLMHEGWPEMGASCTEGKRGSYTP